MRGDGVPGGYRHIIIDEVFDLLDPAWLLSLGVRLLALHVAIIADCLIDWGEIIMLWGVHASRSIGLTTQILLRHVGSSRPALILHLHFYQNSTSYYLN